MNGLKRKVIQRRTDSKNKSIGNKLAIGIKSYEKSQITKDGLLRYYAELKAMAKT